ncbi:hypothetical protein HN873_052540, partial [Arachis hypogaea]
MSVDTLERLCELLKVQGGLRDECRISIPEQVITFLIILAHHKKNHTLQVRFYRSEETISRYFNKVLSSVIRVQSLLFAKDCLGALDGTYIDVVVPEKDKSRYRTRKSKISTNVLGVCNRDMNFVYVLPLWIQESLEMPFHVIITSRYQLICRNYYLVDAGYTNCKGFLAPYRHTRYHHSSARNIIERCSGLLKKRCAILRSHYFYKIKTQNRIIIACCLLQNFIRLNMEFNPEEDTLLDEEHVLIGEDHGGNEDGDDDMIENIEGSNDWAAWRDNLANE